MQKALDLAALGIGNTGPNPSVGCVIVRDNQVISQARTAPFGRPHAEPLALVQAGNQVEGATLYVTLEPCAHHGQTPPCVQAIIAAKPAKVVIALQDPYPKVDGQGIAQLQSANIAVQLGDGAAQATEITRGFISRVRLLHPWVTLKIATTADGFIAREDGSSKWITEQEARNHGHHLRSRNDAILTGSGTYLADAPQLTCRIDGLEALSPARHVLDRRSRIAQTDFTLRREATLPQLLRAFANEGVNHLMVEAGASLSQAFLRENLVDELYWYSAPTVSFGQGISAFEQLWQEKSLPAPHQRLTLGNDILTVYRFTDPQSLLKG